MPRLNQVITVTLEEKTGGNDKRSWTVAIEVNAQLFILSDELAKEGAIRDLQSSLRSVIRDAVAEYIGSGRKFIKGMKNRGVAKLEKK